MTIHPSELLRQASTEERHKHAKHEASALDIGESENEPSSSHRPAKRWTNCLR